MYNKKEWVSKEVITKEALNNIENGIADLDERLENLDMSDKQDKTDNNLITESKDIVGAINELFQSANNGKEIIADAIGEPLNAEDTFAAMGNDIKGLLSTFKTNMMNNGVAVEAGDKFKQLIDKLISDNTNKEEITYLLNAPDYYDEEFYNDLKTHSTHIEGYSYPVITLKDTVNNGVISFDMTGSSSSGYTGTNCVLSVFTNNKIDLTNVTSIKIVAKRTSSKAVTSFGIFSQFVNVGHPGHPDFAKYITIATTDSYVEYTLDTTEVIGEHYIGITVTTSNLTNKGKAYVYVQSIMLTGISKNDALRDSLASILIEEGVDVTEEDDMASLIGKVDSEFDRKNANSGLDIISATQLPATGKENQICVITDNPVERFMLSNSSSDHIEDGSAINGIISYGANSSTVLSTSGSVTTRYGFTKFTQEGSFLPSYIYQNGSWNQFTFDSIYIVQDMNHITDNIFGGLYNVQSSDSVINTPFIANEGLTYYCYTADVLVYATTVNAVDVSNYSKIIIRASNAYGTTTTTTPRIAVYRSTTAQTNFQTNSYMPPAYVADKIMVTLPTGNMEYHEYEFDISNWTGTYNIGIMIDCVKSAALVHISDIYIY